MLSLKKGGMPIASIKGGKYDKKTLYLHKSDDVNVPITLDNDIIKKLKDPKMKDNHKLSMIASMLKTQYKNNDMDDDSDSIDERDFRCEGKLSVLPPPKTVDRRCVYVSGPSGSGKSTWISNYGMEYKDMYPKNQIVLFSRLDKDESIDKIKPTRVEISEDLMRDSLSPEDLKDTLTIFDDTDTIRDKKIKVEVNALKNDILETGRHHNVNTVVVSHLMNNREETKIILNECAMIVFFPKCGNIHQINYLLTEYVGLQKKTIEQIMNLPSRWVCLHKHYPMFIVYETGCFLL